MTPEQIIQQTTHFVRREFEGDLSGHDWWHIQRVYNNALAICRHEKAHLFTVQLAALLHDLDDWKLVEASHGTPRRAAAWLLQMQVDPLISAHVCGIITHLSFKGAAVENHISTIEGMIVQDADRLDAIGAVGIARAFAYGGHKGRAMHNPDQPPHLHDNFEDYKSSQGATINHFYEKLLLLKERMNTQTAQRIAARRHAFMEEFLAQFLLEWDGSDLDAAKA